MATASAPTYDVLSTEAVIAIGPLVGWIDFYGAFKWYLLCMHGHSAPYFTLIRCFIINFISY